MIYLDNASTTPVDPDVYRTIQPYFCDVYGNPSSLHNAGRKAKQAVEKAREQCALALGCELSQIFFTSGGTESDNWAIQMHHEYLGQWMSPNNKILYSSIEHKAILNNIDKELDIPIPVDKNGIVDIDFIKSAYYYDSDEDKITVCVMGCNNECGSIQPIKTISDFCYEHNIPFHTDCVQLIGKESINLKELKGVTSLAISGHKIGATKGIGVLFIRDPKADYVKPFIHGGGQEHGLRAGTENVPAIVGLGAAMEKIANKNFDNTQVCDMNKLLRYALSEIPKVQFNSSDDLKICDPHYLNVSFYGVEGEALELALDRRGICVSAGSACNSGSLEPSHVLKVMGVSEDYINGTIRITFSNQNTIEECEYVAQIIKEEVAKLRSISPSWKGSDA